jgi:hypothetical protein
MQSDGRLKITAVCNFHSRIVRDLVFDDGEQERREFALEALVGETRLAFAVSAAEFNKMDWVLPKLGPRAIVYPGQHQHARAAIQSFSGEMAEERILCHMGWRHHDDRWVYLHAGGALGSDGAVPNLQVQLPPALQAYRVEQPQNSKDRADAVRNSLGFLQVAADRISFPLLAGIYAAALGSKGFSLFLAGRSGVFKTALAALCQQHFGPTLDASRLPANFASTANALETLSFHAKDALLVADDFVPTGTQSDRGLQSLAERLFRSAGNQQGRSRLTSSGRSTGARPPRALLLATGEEVPAGQSVRARLVIIEVATGEVNAAILTECQKVAQQGRLAISMGSFLAWVAGQYDSLQVRWRSRVQEIRSQGLGRTVHARLPSALAELQASFEIFLEFAVECGAIGAAERNHLTQRNILALDQLINRQVEFHLASDPATRFVTLLQTALRTGQAHAAGSDGQVPPDPAAWGWRKTRTWVPQGTRIGWLNGPSLFLEPSISYQVAQQVAGRSRLSVSEQTLRRRLQERQLLASVDVGRHMLMVRRTIQKKPRQVLHLRASELVSSR